jgi:hypothetical protein
MLRQPGAQPNPESVRSAMYIANEPQKIIQAPSGAAWNQMLPTPLWARIEPQTCRS